MSPGRSNMRAGEVVRLGVGGIDEAQKIVRIVQSKGARIGEDMLNSSFDLSTRWQEPANRASVASCATGLRVCLTFDWDVDAKKSD